MIFEFDFGNFKHSTENMLFAKLHLGGPPDLGFVRPGNLTIANRDATFNCFYAKKAIFLCNYVVYSNFKIY